MKLSVSNFLYAIKNIVMGGGRATDGTARNDSGFLKRAGSVGLQNVAPTSDTAATATVFTVLDIGGVPDSTLVAADSVFSVVDIGGAADKVLVAVPFNATWSQAQADVINNNFEDLGTCINTIIGNINNNDEDLATKVNALVVDVAAIRAKLGLTTDETNARVIKVEEAIDTIGNITFAIPRDYDEATDQLYLRVLASMVSVSTDTDVQLDSEFYKKRAGVALGSDVAPAAPSTILSTTEQWIKFDYTGNSLQRDDVVTIELLTDGHNDTNGEEVLIHALELVYRSTLVSYDETDGTRDGKDGNMLR